MTTLSDLFSAFGSDPNANYQSIISQIPNAASGLANLYSSAQNAGANNAIQAQQAPVINQNTAAMQAQIQQLQAQEAQQQQDAANAYSAAQQSTNASNQSLQGTIAQQQAALTALSDPNSAYMQNAQATIAAQDAAAGRNSQWGQRAVQLAGTLGQYVSQYSPAMTNAITQAQNQINTNNTGLANQYATYQKSLNNTQDSNIKALQDQIAAATQASTLARSNAANATSQTNNALQRGISGASNLVGGLAGLFQSNGNGATDNAYSNLFSGTQNAGITGQGNYLGATSPYALGDLTSYTPVNSVFSGGLSTNNGSGYGSLPLGNYFGGTSIGGSSVGDTGDSTWD